jgi:hypothetical protein
MEREPPPPLARPHSPKEPNLYFILTYTAAFLFVALPLVNELAFLQLGPAAYAQNLFISIRSNQAISALITVGWWLTFFAIFYYFIGKRVDFQRNYGKLAIVASGGLLTFYVVFTMSFLIGQQDSFLLVQQYAAFAASTASNFGLLFGALSLAFLRTQLPSSDSPPLELATYRRPSSVGLITLLTSFASPVVSGFIAALLFQEGQFGGGPFSFLSYYFGEADPLFANYIIYPCLFILLLYYIGKKVDFHRRLLQVALYLFAGGFIGHLTGSPLGGYLKVFFNPPRNPSSGASALSQLYAINMQTITTSVFDAALLTLLGISVMTIALLRRPIDIQMDEDDGYDEETPAQEAKTTTPAFLLARCKIISAVSTR